MNGLHRDCGRGLRACGMDNRGIPRAAALSAILVDGAVSCSNQRTAPVGTACGVAPR